MQRFRCTRCGKSFSESQPLDGLRIEDAKAVQIVKLLCEGVGVRGCARLTGCHTHTVLAVLEAAGAKCEAFLDQRLVNLRVEHLQIDEIWAKLVTPKAGRTLTHREVGGLYTFLGIDADTKLILSHYTGPRDSVSTDFFIADVAKRLAGPVQITTDGWQAYPDTIRRYITENLNYAVMQKLYGRDRWNPADPVRRYSPPACIGVRTFVEAGNPDPAHICTSHIERANLSVRHFNKRFVRLGIGISRKAENHAHAVSLFVAAYNFCKAHRTLGTTPAVESGLTDHVWTVEELLQSSCAYGQ